MSVFRPQLLPFDDSAGAGVASVAPPDAASVQRRSYADDLLRFLPTDQKAGSGSSSVAVASLAIGYARMNRLSQIAADLGSDSRAFFRTVFAILLARLTGQEKVSIRDHPGVAGLLAFHFDPAASFHSLLKASVEQIPSANEQSAVEYVFRPMDPSLAALSPNCLRIGVHSSENDPRADCQVRISSSTGVWSRALLQLWLRYFDRLLAEAAAAPEAPWQSLLLLDPAEAKQFYTAFNRTAKAFLATDCVHDLIVRRAERSPDALAVVSESQSLTYRELNEWSLAIAARLQTLGAGSQRPVAVCMERSVQLAAALLGILRSGSCYVPLDTQNSPQRLASILQECRPVAMLVDQPCPPLPGLPELPLLSLNDIQDAPATLKTIAAGATLDHLAYIIYTSGSTGKPKGVKVTHRALANLLDSIKESPGFAATDRMLAVSPISFDIATMDMFLPLSAGATLFIGDRLVASDPIRLAALLQKFDITVLQATPVTWRLLASSDWEGKRGLKMISGGEALPRDLANQLLDRGGELWNCYGPTETTIYSSVLRIESKTGVVPVGPPIANTAFYILDQAGRLLPPGVPGELYIGGTGVSPGYVDSSLEAGNRFVPDPYAPQPGSRMFQSGDLVRLIHGNEFEFFGRLDYQVKLHGYRIELGEIEYALRTSPEVRNAVVGLRESDPGEPYLIAYLTANDKQLDIRQLRDHISRLLPAYMVPSRFVLMDAMPLTASGKIDRKTLLASVSSGLTAYRMPEGVGPRTDIERKLLTIFRDILNTAELGVTDSFFDYGGYSLLTVRLFTRINRAFKLALPISLLFDAPTVQALALIINGAKPLSLIVPIRPRGRTAPLFVIHSYLLYDVLPHLCEPDRPVYGVRELINEDAAQSVEERATAYAREILKLYPKGPVLLTGWCAAGSLTVEIARQLRQIGREVGLVALFDAECPGYRPVYRGSRFAGLFARLRFHARRLRGISIRQKLDYVRNALLHSWDIMIESLFMRHRELVTRLQRVFGFSLPDAVFNNTWSRVADLQNYTPSSYPGRVTLFRAADVPELPSQDETLGWMQVASDGVEVVFVPGDHESMFHQPNLEFFSSRFRQALQQAE